MTALLLALLCVAAPAADAPDDPVALVSMLVQDGNWARAASVHATIDPDARGLDRQGYFKITGVLYLQQGRAADAAKAFAEAIAENPESADPPLHQYHARALLVAGRPDEALAALARGGAAVDLLPGTWLVRSGAHRARGDLGAAYDALLQGESRFPDVLDFPRRRVLQLVELGLTREAGEAAAVLLARPDVTVEDALAIAEAMKRSGAHDRAAVLLEETRLRHPGKTEVLLVSASVALDADRPLAAARFLQIAAELDPQWAYGAADLYKRAGRLEQALYLNSRVTDATDKVRQRFGLLLDDNAFERAVALQDRLSRLGLLSEDPVRYGLAYAWFRLGELDRAERMLDGIVDPDVFRQATGLREAMARAAESGALP